MRVDTAYYTYRVTWVSEMNSSGQPVPEPLATRAFSGKFNLRLGEELHRRLVKEAAMERISLNQYVVRKLNAS